MTRGALALAVLLSSAGCGGGERDLKQELRELTRDLRVDPLPQLREREPAVYRGAKFADPFHPPEKRR
jgi:Tfp pilus assembly protein PilP